MGMSAILRNGFVNWVAALTAVLCALGWVPNASAQDSDPRITGSCTPRTQDQGPWDCKINKWIEVQCPTNKSTGYDDVWKSIRNVDEASELLKSMYLKLGGLVKFSEWLGCQGFNRVYFFSPMVQFPSIPDNDISVHMWIMYSPEKSPFPVSWANYFIANGAHFEIYFDNFGQVKKIQHGYSYE
jgi:hypothetical protein